MLKKMLLFVGITSGVLLTSCELIEDHIIGPGNPKDSTHTPTDSIIIPIDTIIIPGDTLPVDSIPADSVWGGAW